ncbi:MAG: hypothetical protein QMD32_06725, partial [Smithellaceae bacterium]|nr:hypothetical protein [Smithellaceae bacterium]
PDHETIVKSADADRPAGVAVHGVEYIEVWAACNELRARLTELQALLAHGPRDRLMLALHEMTGSLASHQGLFGACLDLLRVLRRPE